MQVVDMDLAYDRLLEEDLDRYARIACLRQKWTAHLADRGFRVR